MSLNSKIKFILYANHLPTILRFGKICTIHGVLFGGIHMKINISHILFMGVLSWTPFLLPMAKVSVHIETQTKGNNGSRDAQNINRELAERIEMKSGESFQRV